MISLSSPKPRDDAARYLPTVAGAPAAAVCAVAYLGIMVTIAVYLPRNVFDPLSDVFILSIGAIGIWRYGWWFVHLVRAVIYRRLRFPRLRRAATEVTRRGDRPRRVFALCTSYRIEPRVTYAVYDGLVRNALDYGVPTTVFAAVTDRSDVDVLEGLLAEHGHPDLVEIRYMFQRGDGKRSAMAEALRAIARREPRADDLVVFMDGDIRLPPGTFRRSMPFFLLEDDLGAVTTDNRAVVDGGDFTREWYDLRYAQRHLLMSSTSLSRRVLVLTGRYSVIRADLCTRRSFIELVERDRIEHPRFGTVTFLSGDDKSTWYWLLAEGWAMRYVPDVQVRGFESLPDPDRFLAGTLDLMRRWFGNMYRTSGRAIRLGPRPMGAFIWWCLVDQRLSAWTTLLGPTVAIALSLFVRPSFGVVYLLWIMSTRLVAAALIGAGRGRFSPLWPPLLYYNQIAGAALKTWVSFRFDQQRWSRQRIDAGSALDPRIARRVRRESAVLHAAGVLLLVSAATFASGALPLPDGQTWRSIALRGDAGSDDYWVRAALERTVAGGAVALGAERVSVHWRTLAGTVRLRGTGPERTVLAIGGVPAHAELASADAAARVPATARCGEGRGACRLDGRIALEDLTVKLRNDFEGVTDR